MNKVDDMLFQLLKVALGNAQSLPVTPSPEEWEELMMLSARQGAFGVAFCGVERLPVSQRPPLDVLMDWSSAVVALEKENLKLNQLCVKVCSIFAQERINACILKGQGVGALYASPLRRCSGDIDVWMDGGRDRVVSYIRKSFKKTEGDSGQHIAVKIKGDVSMEVHYVPARLFNPFSNHRFRAWLDDNGQSLWNNKTAVVIKSENQLDDAFIADLGPAAKDDIFVPPLSFNLVYIISHTLCHWATLGCGMKQILDYYHVVQAVAADSRADELRLEATRMLRRLGYMPFASALMHIFSTRLGMPESCLLCPPDSQLGEMLASDLMRYGTPAHESLDSNNVIVKFGSRFVRLSRLCRLIPNDYLWVLPKCVDSWVKGYLK